MLIVLLASANFIKRLRKYNKILYLSVFENHKEPQGWALALLTHLALKQIPPCFSGGGSFCQTLTPWVDLIRPAEALMGPTTLPLHSALVLILYQLPHRSQGFPEAPSIVAVPDLLECCCCSLSPGWTQWTQTSLLPSLHPFPWAPLVLWPCDQAQG